VSNLNSERVIAKHRDQFAKVHPVFVCVLKGNRELRDNRAQLALICKKIETVARELFVFGAES